MQTLYRTSTDLGTGSPVAATAQVPGDELAGHSERPTLRDRVDAFLRAVTSARPGLGD